MKKILILFLALLIGGFIGTHFNSKTQAQAASALPLQMSVSGAHTLCTVAAGITSYCFASDGIWQSINGSAYVQVGGTLSGIASITVNGGTAQTGPNVALTIPTKAISTTTTTIQ